jgi:hypothetical protein
VVRSKTVNRVAASLRSDFPGRASERPPGLTELLP